MCMWCWCWCSVCCPLLCLADCSFLYMNTHKSDELHIHWLYTNMYVWALRSLLWLLLCAWCWCWCCWSICCSYSSWLIASFCIYMHTHIGDELHILWSYTCVCVCVYGVDDPCFVCSFVHVVLVVVLVLRIYLLPPIPPDQLLLFLYICTHIQVMNSISSSHIHVCIHGLDDPCFDCFYVHVVLVLVLLICFLPLFCMADYSFSYIYAHMYGWWAPYHLIIYMCV